MSISSPRKFLIRREQFCASHRLYNPEFDENWNFSTYGKCSRVNGHGHNYIMEIHVEGQPDPATGMIMNLTHLKAIIDETILQKVDHMHLNHDVAFLAGINPTTENVALAFWHQLENKIPNKMLYKIRLWETEKNIVEIIRS